MFALHSRRLRRRLSAPTSGSARRRARERRRAEQTRLEGERLARQRREQRFYEKMEQHRVAREQLASYEPWGRAGGGAPNPRGVRYTKLRASEIYPEDELKGICVYEACRRWPSPRRTRRQTPLRLREDPQTCYTEALRRTVDNDIRYRQTPDQQRCYKEILDDMVTEKNRVKKAEMKQDKEYERQMQALDGPWGKPSPGGTTWRNPRDIGLNFSKSMGWTDNEIFSSIKRDQRRNQRSSLTLPKVKREDDSFDSTPDKENTQPSNVKLPDIQLNNSASKKERRNKEKEQKERSPCQEQNRKEERKVDRPCREHNACKDSNSKPRKETHQKDSTQDTRKVKKSKFVKRLPNGERLQRIVPDENETATVATATVVSNDGEKKLTPETAILSVTGGIELVPLLARRRRVGARTLPSSDVTRPPEQSCQWRESLHEEYLRELKRQIQVKYDRKEECRLESAESVRKHHATWESLWGRPGHGAPLRGKYARSNLAQLLYVSPMGSRAAV